MYKFTGSKIKTMNSRYVDSIKMKNVIERTDNKLNSGK